MMDLGPIEAMVLGLSVAVLVALIVVGRFTRLSTVDVELWARSRGLAPTAEIVALAEPELLRTRRYRRAGAAFGLLGLPSGLLLPGVDPMLGLLVGWTLAISVAEAALRRRPTGTTGALAATRRLDQYVPRRLLALQAVLTLLTVAAATWALTIDATDPLVTNGDIVTDVVTAVAVGVVLHVLQRWVVARPQPVEDPLAVAVDDAFRSDAVHALGAAALGISFLLLGRILQRPAYEDVLNPFVDLAMIATGFGAAIATLWWANRAWTVRRPRLNTTPPIPTPAP